MGSEPQGSTKLLFELARQERTEWRQHKPGKHHNHSVRHAAGVADSAHHREISSVAHADCLAQRTTRGHQDEEFKRSVGQGKDREDGQAPALAIVRVRWRNLSHVGLNVAHFKARVAGEIVDQVLLGTVGVI